MMNLVAFAGALEQGFLYGLVALGVYISFRILDFPDLTVDGTFPLGGAVAASLMMQGVHPLLATGLAIVAGAIAGLCTAVMNVYFKILNLLASILTMIALYSINLRIMGQPNIALLGQETLVSGWKTTLQSVSSGSWLGSQLGVVLLLGMIAIAAKVLLDIFFKTEMGLAMRATGANPSMARAQGISTNQMILLGMAMSNGLVALAGALAAQVNGFADVQSGVGTIVFGLAAVIVGETLLPGLTVFRATIAAILGSILYRLAIAFALELSFLGLKSQDLNLITAILVGAALVIPRWQQQYRKRSQAVKN
ncbi:MAG: ABC transporter permease [Synechococcales bacterium]|nr:ABC transporter permease [Synechococcales bacterium]